MQRKSILFIIMIVFFPFLLKAEWVPLYKQSTSPTPPNITLISDDNNSTVIRIEIAGFEQNDFFTGNKNYQKIDLLLESFLTNPGHPKVPYISQVLAIPDKAALSVEVLETGNIHTFSNINLPPARESWYEGSPETAYTENSLIYGSDKSYPGNLAQMDQPSVFRDLRISRLSVFPMRYNPAKKQLEVVSSLTVRINYGTGEVINPKTSAKRPITPSFGKLYNSFIFNYQSVLEKSYGGKEEGHELMLCIMPDDFYNSFLAYSEWKRQSGVDIHITKFSDIGANPYNEDIIKDHIDDAYFNWEVPPTHVLIIGDDDIFPKKMITLDGWTFPSDNYFVEIDGNDFFPDLMIGRFTNQGDYRLQVMINKFLKYEQTPYVTETDWFKKGTCCSNNAYTSQVTTKSFAAERMLVDGGFTSVDEMMSDWGCTYDLQDVMSAINEGRSYLNYRGEGWNSGWAANCYQFEIDDVYDLTNGEKMTFVTSIGCGVAMFDGPGNNCFGEAWVECGSLSNVYGAPAFIGPTSNTHTTYNNKIDKGIYVGMFQEGMDTPGQALIRGGLYMYNVFGISDPWVEYHYKVYCTLGDPSIHIWKDVPQEVTVNHPATIPIGYNLVEFSVNHTSSGQPVSDAVVCVTSNTIFETGITDETGIVHLDIEVESSDILTVTVRGGNVYPFQDTITVLQPTGPYVISDTCDINDIAGGNGNSIMETSENILASLTVKNVGIQDATNVVVTLATTNEYITITDNTEPYGTIAAGASVAVPDGFEWDVADNVPDLHNITFEVTATDGTDIWTSFFNLTAHAPILDAGPMTIDDSGGNGDGHIDPGETVNLIFSTNNNGTFQADGTIGSLICSSEDITLNNATYDFGVIPAESMEEAIFNITVAPDAPLGTGVIFTYDVTSGGYSVQKDYTSTIGLVLEDWESGDMSQFDWETGGSSGWEVTTGNPYEGIYCAQSGDISNNENSYLSLQHEVIGTDSISFWYKVSSEANCDYLKFYIDGEQVGQWAGEVGWTRKAYEVSAGVHTFEWDYDKDGGVSNGSDCAWLDYITLPPSGFNASFIADITDVCEGATVNFYDQSTSGSTSWNWIFEGGTPATSTLQNPIIEYLSAGVYDVSLAVSNGTSTDTLLFEDYITVSALPETAPAPSGPTTVCANSDSTSYSTTGLTGISFYEWILEPPDAGNVSGTGLTAIIIWTDDFVGEANLKVAGVNDCGTGDYSGPVNITRYLPEVTLEPFNWVCLDWPAFELTGGMPAGGEYSGTGVENGWFDPNNAGAGTHTITYTYTDPEECENFATETIFVDPCTGINNLTNLSGLIIYPNPTTGNIFIDFNQNTGPIEVIVVNTLNDVVYSYSSETLSKKKLNIDLSNLAKGVYFIKAKTDTIEKTTKVVLW